MVTRRCVCPAALLTAAALVAAPLSAQAATLVVDANGTGDYLAVQPALNAAADGDIVLVLPGTYSRTDSINLSFGSKNIVLRSAGGAAVTIIDCENAASNRAIYFNGGNQDSTCVVDGFTIRNGRLSGVGEPGAGIRCESASPKLVNLIVKNNTSALSYGGGLYCNNHSNPIVRDVVFEGNHALVGGGLYCSTESAPIVHNATFRGNHAVNRGGGAYCSMDCDAQFTRVVFESNTSNDRGGGLACFRSSPAIGHSVFFANTAADSGGALYIQRAAYPVIANCTIVANSAPVGGAVCMSESCEPSFMQSIIAFTGAGGSTIRCGIAVPTFTRCVVFGNAPGDDLCGDHYDNIFLDPLFCDVTIGDLTLASNSPCLPGSPQNPWTQLVGALDQGCTSSPVEEASWGRIKSLFR